MLLILSLSLVGCFGNFGVSRTIDAFVVTVVFDPESIEVGGETLLSASITGPGATNAIVTWAAEEGILSDDVGPEVSWTAPGEAGVYTIVATATVNDKSTTSSVDVRVEEAIDEPCGEDDLCHVIYTINDLQAMNDDLDGNYILGNNIDASVTVTWNEGSGFVPIGSGSQPFTGTFAGNGYTIENLYINRPGLDDVGLFGFVASDSMIQEVHLVDANITGRIRVGSVIGTNDRGTVSEAYGTGIVFGSDRVGGLVGSNAGAITDSESDMQVKGTSPSSQYIGGLVGINDPEASVTNSHSAGNVEGTSYVGGLVGYVDVDGLITNSSSSASVLLTMHWGGGLVGDNRGTIAGSYSLGLVKNAPASAGTGYVGGLVGLNGGSIEDSYSTSDVTAGTTVGGLVGHNVGGGIITNAYSIGNVNAFHAVGGLVGHNAGDIKQSYSVGSVEGTGTGGAVGGLVGFNTSGSFYDPPGTVTNSYSMSHVVGTNLVGGLVGNNSNGKITDSYSIGTVYGDTNIGGLVGGNDDETTVTSSYWDVETSGINDSQGGMAKSSAAMKQLGTFVDWSFGEVWMIDDDYPDLADNRR